MRRVLGIVPLAVLSTACGLRPWTPSVSVAFFAEDVPRAHDVALPKSADVARVWQPPPSVVWARWYKGTLPSAVDAMGRVATLPDVRALEVTSRAERAASHLAAAGIPPRTLFVVDLRGAASLAFAARLSQAASEPVAPILTFNNWPSEGALVPADETLAGLLTYVPKLPPAEIAPLDAGAPATDPSGAPPAPRAAKAPVPVFVLDSWRLAYRDDEPEDDAFDNRYMLTASDLPDVATLRAQGITRVVYVVEDLDDAEVEEDDLHASFRAWQTAGLGIYMVDLEFLEETPPAKLRALASDWDVRLAPRAHYVRRRYTLIDDPLFYARARAGFGLAYGRPVFLPGGYRGGGYRGGGYRGGGGS